MQPTFSRRGFTLVEVLTVVAIIGILAALAIPRYNQYTVRTYRSRATGCLVEIAQAMERRFTVEMSYADDPNDPQLPNAACLNDTGLADRYEFELEHNDERSFELSAVPQGTQADRDARCGTLTLNHLGQRGADDDACW